MRSFKHKGLIEIRGTDFARIRGEARVELPKMAHVRHLTIEGEALHPCHIEVRLADRLLGRLQVQGAFQSQFPLAGGPSDGPLILHVLEKRRTLVQRLTGQGGSFSNVHLRRILVDDEPMVDFSQSAACFFPRLSAQDAGLGLNIIGFFQHTFGVGEAARSSALAARAAHIPCAIVPTKIGTDTPATEESWTPWFTDANPHPLNLFHLDAPQTAFIDECHGPQFRAGRYNIAYWAWELPEFPDTWLPNFEYVDEVWTPSRFTQEAIAAKAPVPVLTMPHAIEVKPPAAVGRATLGLPERDFLFLTVFDLGSSQVRKNPQGALQAFRMAFPNPHGVRLIVKVHGGDPAGPEAETLRMAVSETPGALLIQRTMARPDLTALQAACDCFVSLHRAEGFGLALAECMALARPVLATGWSGNLEFMNPSNSCLVNYQLVPIEHTAGPYKKGQQWAAPDLEHAAWWMRELVQNQQRREEIGRAGQLHVCEYLAPQRIGHLYARRLKALYHWI